MWGCTIIELKRNEKKVVLFHFWRESQPAMNVFRTSGINGNSLFLSSDMVPTVAPFSIPFFCVPPLHLLLCTRQVTHVVLMSGIYHQKQDNWSKLDFFFSERVRFFLFFFNLTFTFQPSSQEVLPSAIFWTSRGHRCRPFSSPVRAFIFRRA